MTRTLDDWALLGENSKLGKILTELKQRHPAAQRSGVDETIVQQVREIEQGTMAPPQMASLRSAHGEEIERLSVIDGLTELYNTKTFFKELKDELKRASRYGRAVSLCLIAIDGFSELVQEYGSLTGEAVLKVVANVVRSCQRENDIAARYTADKYAVIFPESNGATAGVIAERIRQRIGIQAISHNWHNLKVTASVGVASFPLHAREYDELIARAEEVLQLAMERGGDRVCLV